jgi:hypothetical protein
MILIELILDAPTREKDNVARLALRNGSLHW